jgi:hypothetical protein
MFQLNYDETLMPSTHFSVQPTLAYRPFRLMTVYPRKIVEDEQQSLQEAGLLNAAVAVKFDD